MFRLDDQTLRYGDTTVLANVSLTIARGERVSLLGRSGAGKSTLLKVLHAQAAAQVALIPQDPALVQTLSVFHNVYMGRLHAHPTWYNLRNLIHPAATQIEAMQPLLERLGLETLRRVPVGTLSGGQRQRTAIARALHQQRPALLGDEPVSAVDPHQARDILEFVRSRHDTLVLAMHDVSLALEFSDRIIGLDAGRITLDAPSRDLDADYLARLYTHGDAAALDAGSHAAASPVAARNSC